MSKPLHDRSLQDIGNVVLLEHMNVKVPDIEMAALFYVHALGFTRDPYIDLGPDLMWINLGEQQFHLPVGEPQVLRGVIEVVVPSLATMQARLEAMTPQLVDTEFDVCPTGSSLEVVGPWGNRFRCYGATATQRMQLGMCGIEFSVPRGSAAGIGRFYERVMGAHVAMAEDSSKVRVGPNQSLCFVETDETIADYDGHHIAIYVSDFSHPYGWLADRNLIIEDIQKSEYRFQLIVDPDSGEPLFEVEHEVRSLHHPLRGRTLVNRNPDQKLATYAPGFDVFHPRQPGSPTGP